MTYTVKNGTWCKDNDKEYYSTTKAGLKAALAAGEITAGTKVVIHEPKYHAGQLIQSLNPNCPEGCFVPHGQAFNKSIYEELAKVFPSGVLPDMRECVMVCAGRSERTEITNHDEYTAGQFKDDQFAEHNHSARSTVTDPGHWHSVTDLGHTHTIDISDPGHEHVVNVTDPGHNHTVNISDPGHEHNVTGTTTNTYNAAGGTLLMAGTMGTIFSIGPNSISGTAESKTTGITATADSNTTGITATADSNTTGITATANSSKTWVLVRGNTTGITVDTTVANEGAADNVTRTKQFGVYYYIAF